MERVRREVLSDQVIARLRGQIVSGAWPVGTRIPSEPELVEIGYFIAITMGQQRWLRTLNIEHHQIMAGQDGSMAPGFETMDKLVDSKKAADYWAKINPKPVSQAAE